jgi:hypothetical protein
MEEYLDSKIRRDLATKISNLELPPEWRPYEVIRYIVRIIEHGEAPRQD